MAIASISRRNEKRFQDRVPMAIALKLAADRAMAGAETTFTENVSTGGARVISARPWIRNQRLSIESLPGDFRATARVAYCHRLRDDGYAVGLEFLEPSGEWVIGPLPGSGK